MTDKITSVLLMAKMLPNKYPNKSTLKPFDKLANMIPPEIPTAETIPIAESPYTFALLLILIINNEPNKTTGIAIKVGNTPKNKPSAIPPKLKCESPSPIKDIFFKTKKIPKIEQVIAINDPAINAF